MRGAVTLWRGLMERFRRHRSWWVVVHCERAALIAEEFIWISKNTPLRCFEAHRWANSSRWVNDCGLETTHDVNSTREDWGLGANARTPHRLETTTKRLTSTAHTRWCIVILYAVRRVGLWRGTPKSKVSSGMLPHSNTVRAESLVINCVWRTTHWWLIRRSWRMTTVTTTARKHARECLFRVGDSGLFRAGSRAGIKLFAVFKCFSTLLVQSSLLREHIDYQVYFFSDWVAPVDAIFVIREVAQGRYFVHVAFKLDDCRRRSILDNKFNCCQRF